ncbi:MAG: hypothetical protein U5K72_11910 [Balneolaceae bacterium]|nr:hypothetical protein [Balneolaceae bacterium]
MAQQVHTYVGSDSLQVGDEFTYTIVFEGNYNTIQFPGDEDFEEDLSVNSIQRYQSPAGRDSIVYNLQFFAIENLTISEKEIAVQTEEKDTTYTTAPVPLFFKTSLAAEDDEFRPMKPIFDFARNWWPWILGVIALLIAGYYFYRFYTNREIPEEIETEEPAPPPPFSSPLDELKETISNLPNVDSLETEEQFEQFYIDLGDAIRLYIKRVYEFQALEMTTSEITLTLQEELAPPKLISITRKVLNEADIVKFANFNPGTKGARSALETAETFIETAEVVNYEQIKYMKYKYEVEHGIRKDNIIQTTDQPT